MCGGGGGSRSLIFLFSFHQYHLLNIIKGTEVSCHIFYIIYSAVSLGCWDAVCGVGVSVCSVVCVCVCVCVCDCVCVWGGGGGRRTAGTAGMKHFVRMYIVNGLLIHTINIILYLF